MKKTTKYSGVEQVHYILTEHEIQHACIEFIKSYENELPGDDWSYESCYNYDINGEGILVIELIQCHEVEQEKPK